MRRMTSEFWYCAFWTAWIVLFKFLIISPLVGALHSIGVCK